MDELKQNVLQTARQCYNEALFAGTSGNLSALNRSTGVLAITPSSVPYPTMEEADIVLMQLDGTVLEARHKPSSEWRLHAELYKALPGVNAVVHTHSPFATSFAVAGKPVPLILIEMVAFLGGEVPLAPFAVPGTRAVGTGAAQALQEASACLMANHGVVAVGASLPQAHLRATYVEDAAKIATYANINGGYTTLSAADAQAMRDVLAGRLNPD